MNDIQQHINRLNELMSTARQRYLKAGGDPHRTPSGLKGDDYLTDEERQEALLLARTAFNDEYIKSYLSTYKKNEEIVI